VGRLVARFLRRFDTRLLGYDRYVTPAQAAELGVELVDLEALLSVTDVIEEEPLTDGDVWRTLDTVVLTPHVAGSTDVMFRRCGRKAIAALQAYFGGKGELP
jgi:phosphoglycerate dehydrogenase-like enzyme